MYNKKKCFCQKCINLVTNIMKQTKHTQKDVHVDHYI